MPDYFVPLDTTLNSRYLNELYNSNSIAEYAFNYANSHQAELKNGGYPNFYKNFEVTDELLNQLVITGERNKVKADRKDLNRNKKIFQIHVKAQIARRIWRNDGFYPIFNETNEVLQQAIKLFDRIPDLKRRQM